MKRTARSARSKGVLSEEQLRTLLAKAYEQAALAGDDMRRVADGLETLRVALLQDNEYEAWNALDLQLGRGLGTSLEEVLINLRDRFRRELEHRQAQALHQLATTDAAAASKTLRECWLGALAAWRIEHLAKLTAYDLALPAELDPRDGLRTTGLLLDEERWTEAYLPLAAMLEPSNAETAAAIQAVCAQVQLFHFNCYRLAAKHLQRAKTLAPGLLQVITADIDYARAWHDMDRAKDLSRQQIEAAPNKADGYLSLGKTLARLGDRNGAEAMYRQAIERAPGDGAGYRALLGVYAEKAQYAVRRNDIASLVRKLAVLGPQDVTSIRLFLADRHTDADRFAEAREGYTSILEQSPRFARALLGLGACDLREANDHGTPPERAAVLRGKANDALERAIAIAPQAPENYAALAWLAHGGGDLDAAVAQLERGLVACGPQSELSFGNDKAHLLLLHKSYTEAAKTIEASLGTDPGNREALALLLRVADALVYEQKDAAGAERLYDMVRQGWGELGNDSYYNRLGNLRYYEADYAAAADYYRKAIALNSDDHVLHSNLAGALMSLAPERRSPYLSEATRALQHASALAPTHAEYRERLRTATVEEEFVEVYGADALGWVPRCPSLQLLAEGSLNTLFVDETGENLRSELVSAMAALRERVLSRTGVTLPGVNFGVLEEPAAAGEFQLKLNGFPLEGRLWIDPKAPDAFARLADALEVKLAAHLEEFITIELIVQRLEVEAGETWANLKADPAASLALTLMARDKLRESGAVDSLATLCSAYARGMALELNPPTDVLGGPVPIAPPKLELRLPSVYDARAQLGDAFIRLRTETFEETGVILPVISIVDAGSGARVALVIGDETTDLSAQLRATGASGPELLRSALPFAEELIANAEKREITSHLVAKLRHAEREYLRPLTSTLSDMLRSDEERLGISSRRVATIAEETQRICHSKLGSFLTATLIERYLEALRPQWPDLVTVCRALISTEMLTALLAKRLARTGSLRQLSADLLAVLADTTSVVERRQAVRVPNDTVMTAH